MKVSASYAALGALALYLLMTSFPRELPLVVGELTALLTVAVTAGTLLGHVAERLHRLTLYGVSVATCFVGHAAFIRLAVVLEVLLCGAWRRGCAERGMPMPTIMLAPHLLVLGVLVAYAIDRLRMRIAEEIAAKRAARFEAFE